MKVVINRSGVVAESNGQDALEVQMPSVTINGVDILKSIAAMSTKISKLEDVIDELKEADRRLRSADEKLRAADAALASGTAAASVAKLDAIETKVDSLIGVAASGTKSGGKKGANNKASAQDERPNA